MLLWGSPRYALSLWDHFLVITAEESPLWVCFGSRGKCCFPVYNVFHGLTEGWESGGNPLPDVLGRGRQTGVGGGHRSL